MSDDTQASIYGENTFDSPAKWAIVLVPGIFGSRLINPITKDSIWNPDSNKWGLGACNASEKKVARWLNVFRTPARQRWEDADNSYPSETIRLRRGYGSVSWDSYGPGIQALEKRFKDDARIFVFGYDWRQDNWESGGKLLEFIYFTVHGEFGIKFKPIVVTHSMGGLVTRAACRRFFDEKEGRAVTNDTGLRGEDMIAGVVHTLMPTYGTPKGYTAWREGWGSGLKAGLHKIVGKTGKKFSARCYATPSVYQLAPNHLYPRQGRTEDKDGDNYWLDFDQAVYNKSESLGEEENPKNHLDKRLDALSTDIDKQTAGGLKDLRTEAYDEMVDAWNEYADDDPDTFDVLRKALLRYPYLLYRDTSGLFGIPDQAALKGNPARVNAAEKCIDLAEYFHVCRVGNTMHSKTWVLYSTKGGKTIVKVIIKGKDVKIETDKLGDATVTDWSAKAFEGRNELQPPRPIPTPTPTPTQGQAAATTPCLEVNAKVAHDMAFKKGEGYKPITDLVWFAYTTLKSEHDLIGNNIDYEQRAEWLSRFPRWTVLAAGKSQAEMKLAHEKLKELETKQSEIDSGQSRLDQRSKKTSGQLKISLVAGERRDKEIAKLKEDIRTETKERTQDADSIDEAIRSLKARTRALEMKAHTHTDSSHGSRRS